MPSGLLHVQILVVTSEMTNKYWRCDQSFGIVLFGDSIGIIYHKNYVAVMCLLQFELCTAQLLISEPYMVLYGLSMAFWGLSLLWAIMIIVHDHKLLRMIWVFIVFICWSFLFYVLKMHSIPALNPDEVVGRSMGWIGIWWPFTIKVHDSDVGEADRNSLVTYSDIIPHIWSSDM